MRKSELHIVDHPVTNQEDLDTLKLFLKENNLPFEDVRLEGNQFFLYYDGAKIVGCGGLEFYGDYCLLRSIAVANDLRGDGYGKEIVEDLISRAKDKKVWSISLLTETAEKFFEKHFEFKKQSRDDAPKEIKSSSEFSTVCPVSAAFMTLRIAAAS